VRSGGARPLLVEASGGWTREARDGRRRLRGGGAAGRGGRRGDSGWGRTDSCEGFWIVSPQPRGLSRGAGGGGQGKGREEALRWIHANLGETCAPTLRG
jgi:hypothetical protein